LYNEFMRSTSVTGTVVSNYGREIFERFLFIWDFLLKLKVRVEIDCFFIIKIIFIE
jgi:hypothetical protein